MTARQLGISVREETPPFANIRSSSEALDKLQKHFTKRINQFGLPFKCFYEVSASLVDVELEQRLVRLPDTWACLNRLADNV